MPHCMRLPPLPAALATPAAPATPACTTHPPIRHLRSPHGSYDGIFLSSRRVDCRSVASARRFVARVIAFCVWHVPGVGYTMTDILYVWKDGASSVGMSSEVQLPQFRVLGHRQRATVITLSTGNRSVVVATPRRARARHATRLRPVRDATRDRLDLPAPYYPIAPQSATPCGISGTNGTRGPTRWACLTRCRSRSSRCWATANAPWKYL